LKEKQNRKGPVVTYAPAVQNNLRELILDTAEEKKPSSVWLLQELPTRMHFTAMVVWFGFDFAFALCIPLSKWCTVMMLKMSSN
jgi:1,4-dihydroxy-2-naphthoate octaprenyltransferase